MSRYIVQPEDLNVGDVIEASRTKLGSLSPGSSYPLKLLPVGMFKTRTFFYLNLLFLLVLTSVVGKPLHVRKLQGCGLPKAV